MKQLRKFISLFVILTLLSVFLAGCGKPKKEKEIECPFTTIEWTGTVDNITETEEDFIESYDSSFNGTTYTYKKKFKGLDGIVKYMFDDKENLVGLAWSYVSDDADDIKSVYKKLHKETTKKYGKSSFDSNPALTDIWHLESGKIILNAVISDDLKTIQYTFLNPDISQEDLDVLEE